MKSRTSFFNSTVLKKDITRFAPVWGLYSVYLLLVFVAFSSYSGYSAARDLLDLCTGSAIIQMIYGVICAAVLFGDLFNSRMCNALHAMPLRREGWCLNRLTAGLLFFLVPTGLFSLAMLALVSQYWYVPLIFLGVNLLCFLFFFCTGALCSLLAGNRLGMLVLYAILQFFSVFIYSMVTVFYEPFLYGVPVDMDEVLRFSPIMMLSECEYLDLTKGGGIYEIYWEELRYLGITGLLGLLSCWPAVLLYRRRKLEAAGDFLAFTWVKPVFLGVYCLSVGMLLYALGESFDTGVDVIFLLAGLAVGFFTGRMLLQRKVRVFQPKAVGTFLLVLAGLGISVGVVAWDLLGIVRRVPEVQQVEKVEISSGYDYHPLVLEENADLERIIAIHETCLEDREFDYGEATSLLLTYQLKNGKRLTRAYSVRIDSDQGRYLEEKLSNWQCIFGTDDMESIKSRLQYVMYEGEPISAKLNSGLLEAIRQDCEVGAMAQDYRFHQEDDSWTWVELILVGEDGREEYLSIRIFSSCVDTVAFIEENDLHPEIYKYS